MIEKKDGKFIQLRVIEMKRKTTREILAESFRELAVSKPVDKITVLNRI